MLHRVGIVLPQHDQRRFPLDRGGVAMPHSRWRTDFAKFRRRFRHIVGYENIVGARRRPALLVPDTIVEHEGGSGLADCRYESPGALDLLGNALKPEQAAVEPARRVERDESRRTLDIDRPVYLVSE